jgi:hypothetical protein
MDWQDCQTDCEDGLKDLLGIGSQIPPYILASGSNLGAAPHVRSLRSALSRRNRPEALKECRAVLENLARL